MINQLEIALVEPEIPYNTGNIGRTCVALGCKLHICGQPSFDISDKAVKRAGLDYWHDLDLSLWDSVEDLMRHATDAHFYYATTKAQKTYVDVQYQGRVIIFFGKETKGLPEPMLIAHPERNIRIPMMPERRSLNLSNSVAIVAYEVMRQWDFSFLQQTSEYLNF